MLHKAREREREENSLKWTDTSDWNLLSAVRNDSFRNDISQFCQASMTGHVENVLVATEQAHRALAGLNLKDSRKRVTGMMTEIKLRLLQESPMKEAVAVDLALLGLLT